jgi:hypothetical protein
MLAMVVIVAVVFSSAGYEALIRIKPPALNRPRIKRDGTDPNCGGGFDGESSVA